MVFLIVRRGILAPNCTWWKISDTFLNDASGINYFHQLNKKYGPIAPINIWGTRLYLVMDVSMIKEILDGSPNVFNVGKLKYDFFKSFMKDNVGVSSGCPWKRRRQTNEMVLFTDDFHIYSQRYHQYIYQLVSEQNNIATSWDFNTYSDMGTKLAMRVVFNDPTYPKRGQLFQMFTEANSLSSLIFGKTDMNIEIEKNYYNYLNENIQNPLSGSLVELSVRNGLTSHEILHQIPHWMFPIGGLINTSVPRLLTLLCNNLNSLEKLIRILKQYSEDELKNSKSIVSIKYLRYCILETLRLNNPVVTTFRKVETDYVFNNGVEISKGTQLMILNNPILRDESFFVKPNEFIPERWSNDIEGEYNVIMFNQGPQRCPGKELAIFLLSSFIVNFFVVCGILKNNQFTCSKKIGKNVPQMINPCSLEIIVNKSHD